jgi:hypothetical protein
MAKTLESIILSYGFVKHDTLDKTFSGHKFTETRYVKPWTILDKTYVTVTKWADGSKPTWVHRGQQKNGIMAPTAGDTKPQLERTLEAWKVYDASKNEA